MRRETPLTMPTRTGEEKRKETLVSNVFCIILTFSFFIGHRNDFGIVDLIKIMMYSNCHDGSFGLTLCTRFLSILFGGRPQSRWPEGCCLRRRRPLQLHLTQRPLCCWHSCNCLAKATFCICKPEKIAKALFKDVAIEH